MTDYRDDWKYSKPIPKEPTRRAYEEGWERVFAKKPVLPTDELKEQYPNARIHVSKDRP